jgi:anti-sigma B factor antagonist
MTNTASAKLLVLVGKSFACVKIVGRANFTSSVDFRTLINQLLQKGYRYFVLDLSECTLMDSTFLGVLAGFGLNMRGPEAGDNNRSIELSNPNARIIELLDTLGVLHLFRLTQGPLTTPECTETAAVEPGSNSREELTRACLEAHQTLMEINPQNISRFKEVTQFLSEDLKKLKSQA